MMLGTESLETSGRIQANTLGQTLEPNAHGIWHSGIHY